MAPPTVVLKRGFIHIPADCPIVTLEQNECNFNKATGDFNCVPLVRRYRACETPTGVRHYEITDTRRSPEITNATKEMLAMSKSS